MADKLWGGDCKIHETKPELGKLDNVHILISATIHFTTHLLPFFQLVNPLQASHHQVHWKTVTNLRS